jgi:parallel beta-helix repeat protein
MVLIIFVSCGLPTNPVFFVAIGQNDKFQYLDFNRSEDLDTFDPGSERTEKIIGDDIDGGALKLVANCSKPSYASTCVTGSDGGEVKFKWFDDPLFPKDFELTFFIDGMEKHDFRHQYSGKWVTTDPYRISPTDNEKSSHKLIWELKSKESKKGNCNPDSTATAYIDDLQLEGLEFISCSIPVKPNSMITAPSEVCANSTNTASVPAHVDAVYKWDIKNGTIVSPNSVSNITWVAGKSNVVTLLVTVIKNSVSNNSSKEIKINPKCGKYSKVYVNQKKEPNPNEGVYLTIRDALGNVTAGGQIFVGTGDYKENIELDKALRIIGENKDNTIIESCNDKNLIAINSFNILIKGFTLRGGINGIYSLNKGNLTIEDNIISGCIYDGINLTNCNNVEILNNNLSKNNESGLYIKLINNSGKIIDNSITNNGKYGILLKKCDRIEIGENNVNSNKIAGIYLWNTNNSTLGCNTLQQNKDTSICLFQSNNNTFIKNNVSETNYGIVLMERSCLNAIADDNQIKGEKCDVEIQARNNIISDRFKKCWGNNA